MRHGPILSWPRTWKHREGLPTPSPLLRKAIDIRTAALGANHTDVIQTFGVMSAADLRLRSRAPEVLDHFRVSARAIEWRIINAGRDRSAAHELRVYGPQIRGRVTAAWLVANGPSNQSRASDDRKGLGRRRAHPIVTNVSALRSRSADRSSCIEPERDPRGKRRW